MPCESCGVQFSVFRRKRGCSECERWYCAGCLRRGGGSMCAACRALCTRPLFRNSIAHLKVRDLQAFLHRQNVSTRGCVEKEELITLCVIHVNGSSYWRRASRAGQSQGSTFSSLKGFTTNINEFLNKTFDLRPNANTVPPPQNTTHTSSNGSCYNSAHTHAPRASPPHRPTTDIGSDSRREHFTRPPGFFPPTEGPEAAGGDATSSSRSSSDRVETADCFEVEDLDDSGWEFVSRPADPLPTDSEDLLREEARSASFPPRAPPAAPAPPSLSSPRPPSPSSPRPLSPRPPPPPRATARDSPPLTPQRAASVLDLRRSASDDTDTASLKDEPMFTPDSGSQRVELESVRSRSELAALSVRQLKELLTVNRVEFRGCLERRDLLERAGTLYDDHAKYKDEVEKLPLEECCKICMAAPLECVLLECGHMAACTACGKRLSECPICRRYVVRAVRVFRS